MIDVCLTTNEHTFDAFLITSTHFDDYSVTICVNVMLDTSDWELNLERIYKQWYRLCVSAFIGTSPKIVCSLSGIKSNCGNVSCK